VTAVVDGAVDAARRVLGHRARLDAPLAALTTYRVGGNAAILVEAAGPDDLVAVAEAVRTSRLPVLVVGRGSNLLVADAGFRGIAVTIAPFADWIRLPEEHAEDVVVAAGGAVALPVLARRTAAAGITGAEWAVGVPGSVGGAVRMNAGGHGADVATSLLDVDVVDLTGDGTAARRPASELGLHFRGSALLDHEVVVGARFALARGDRAASEAELAEIVRWRREHQPGGQNCGSVFVNPVPGEVTAGSLVDGLGLRGFRIGGAWVSEKHANFVQAAPDARAADVRAVMEHVRARVAEATGYVLRSEVRLVGFDDPGGAA
jgi:UDP-N-acetylmuramate dehydrogenase